MALLCPENSLAEILSKIYLQRENGDMRRQRCGGISCFFKGHLLTFDINESHKPG